MKWIKTITYVWDKDFDLEDRLTNGDEAAFEFWIKEGHPIKKVNNIKSKDYKDLMNNPELGFKHFYNI